MYGCGRCVCVGRILGCSEMNFTSAVVSDSL